MVPYDMIMIEYDYDWIWLWLNMIIWLCLKNLALWLSAKY